LRRIIKQYNLDKDDYKEAFAVCMALTKWKDITGEIAAFNANYGLYRGWTMVAAVNAVYGVALAILSDPYSGLLVTVISLLVAIVFGLRAKRFYRYVGKKVLLTFQLLEVGDKLNG